MPRDFKARKIRKAKQRARQELASQGGVKYMRKKDGKVFYLDFVQPQGSLRFVGYEGAFDPSYFERV